MNKIIPIIILYFSMTVCAVASDSDALEKAFGDYLKENEISEISDMDLKLWKFQVSQTKAYFDEIYML